MQAQWTKVHPHEKCSTMFGSDCASFKYSWPKNDTQIRTGLIILTSVIHPLIHRATPINVPWRIRGTGRLEIGLGTRIIGGLEHDVPNCLHSIDHPQLTPLPVTDLLLLLFHMHSKEFRRLVSLAFFTRLLLLLLLNGWCPLLAWGMSHNLFIYKI